MRRFEVLQDKLMKVLAKYERDPDNKKYVETAFFLLLNKDTKYLFLRFPNFKNVVRRKCYEFLMPQTLYYISPVVHRYFSDDEELIGLAKKVSNYNKNRKRYVRSLSRELVKTEHFCKDIVHLIVDYV